MDYKISIVIRVYNEGKHLREVLDSLSKQIYKNYEVIVLDSESTDDTVKIASSYNVRIEHIKKAEFNYSYASNICVNLANGDLICFLSGHSVPVRDTYLSDINKVFADEKIGGCYGDVIALPDGSITEKLFNKLGYLKNKLKGNPADIKFETSIHPGILSCNNACIRKELLLRHPFAEALGGGGEDVEVAYRINKDGYYIAFIPDLLVMHSHGKSLFEFIKEYRSWRIMYKNVLEYIESNTK